MVGKGKRPKLIGNHQRCWLWGRHAVIETVQAGKWLPVEVYVSTDEPASACIPFQDAGVRVVRESPEELSKLCGKSEHQGWVAKMPEYPYAALDDLLSNLSPQPFVILLDAVQDPFNFGSVLRSAEVFGADGVIVAREHQAKVSIHVARSSVGAVNWLPIAEVDDLVTAAEQLQQAGLNLVAATEKGTQAPSECAFDQPTALIIGNEGTGIRDELLARVTQQVAIPQTGHIQSLNAAVAAGILCYEVQRQRSGN